MVGYAVESTEHDHRSRSTIDFWVPVEGNSTIDIGWYTIQIDDYIYVDLDTTVVDMYMCTYS